MERPKRRRGCFGCLTALLVLVLLLAGWIVAVRSGLLIKLGLKESVAERVLAGPPDRAASAAVMEMLAQSGMNTQGVDVWVLPMAGQSGSLAMVTLDASQGFDLQKMLNATGNGEDVGGLFNEDALEDLNVTRLAFDYVNSEGKSIVTLTAPVQALKEASESEDEHALVKALMGRVDVPGLVREVTP
ncbi:MAG: hypothetical protein GX557_15045 [Chloroflexi bacterium]|nr:hypothetical protein [Chloroflexota bacterium]